MTESDNKPKNDIEGTESMETPVPPEAISEAEKQAENAKKEMLYLRAEFDNYKKRMLKEQSDSIRLANKGLISELLDVVDLFDRALLHSAPLKADGSAEAKSFVSGIEMTHHQLKGLLNRFGVEFIGTVGEKFDPEKHEAISQKDVPEDQVDTVLEVFQKGCQLHGKLLKPARVVVGKKA
jgi:molecular chaperone GrpE